MPTLFKNVSELHDELLSSPDDFSFIFGKDKRVVVLFSDEGHTTINTDEKTKIFHSWDEAVKAKVIYGKSLEEIVQEMKWYYAED